MASDPLNKFRIVCATRQTAEQFSVATALGRSLALFPYPFVELRLFPSNSTGLPALYNIALREAEEDPAILVFIHDDVHLIDFFWPNHIYEGLRAFDVVGLAGNRRRTAGQPAWRFLDDRLTRDERENLSGIVAHGVQWPPQYVSYYGPPYQAVKLLDGLLLACASKTLLVNGIEFDERFAFHFYDLDFCRQAERKGLRLGTCSVSAMHESDGRFGTPAWRAGYAEYLKKWQS
jgi:GT2 family glycosyltransferase